MSALLASFDHVSKLYRIGSEKSNLRALIPGRWGEVPAAEAFKALDDLSFELAAGHSLGFIGENGAGKSTALKVLAGVVHPTSGRVQVNGRIASVIELGVGFNPDFTGAENIEFAGTLLGMAPAEIRRKYDEIVDFSGIEEFMDMPVKRYSTGMAARLGFALVATVEADLFVLDEVLSVGDWGFQRRSYDRVRKLHADGAAIVVVSHNHWVLAQLCDELLLLDRGRTAMSGAPNEVITSYIGPETIGDPQPDLPIPILEMFDDPPPDSPVEILVLELLPAAINPGDPLRFRVRLSVDRPIEAELVMSLYTHGRAVFAEREVGPGHILQEPGIWEVEGRILTVPIAAGAFQVRVAVVQGEPPDAYHQFPGALAVASTDLIILGSFNERPGFKFDTEWSARQLEPGPADPNAMPLV